MLVGPFTCLFTILLGALGLLLGQTTSRHRASLGGLMGWARRPVIRILLAHPPSRF